MNDRGHLSTELRNPRSISLDSMSIEQAFDLINGEDATVAAAVAAARPQICRAIELVVQALSGGVGSRAGASPGQPGRREAGACGRLIYVGAGTSGRLGVLDATECPPTFLSDPEMVQGIIAGGGEALTRSVEGAEDRPEDGAAALAERNVGPGDVVFGIATGGTTPFVHGALQAARRLGAKTLFLACVPADVVTDDADVSIRILTGPEVLTGSTRMKAGTATKMVLNMVTTIAMVRLGKVYQNLMVDVDTQANAKLIDRGTRIVQAITGLPRDTAGRLLEKAEGRVKTALVMHARGVDRDAAEQLLAEGDGRVTAVVDGRGQSAAGPA